MRPLYFIYLLGLLTLASSCSYRQNQLLFEKRASTTTDAQAPAVQPASYHIKPQDQLQIRNLQDISYIVGGASATSGNSGGGGNSNGQVFTVEEDGTVTLPALGHLKVEGLTRIQATQLIESLYKKNLLKDPIIELKVVNLKVTLMGEVRTPGNFPLIKDNTTLVELLGEAGGLNPTGNEKNIKIIRGGKQVTEIDLGDISSISDPNAVLQSGDIVYVSQNKRAIRNDKVQNFSSIAQPALLLLNTALIILALTRR